MWFGVIFCLQLGKMSQSPSREESKQKGNEDSIEKVSDPFMSFHDPIHFLLKLNRNTNICQSSLKT